ncbi:MAG TPA: ankyrin repeat domain-containing protein, partial [Gammaproteobacteria bacterium]|nr:ankyrin repeat domain-containing protein [Gammaproteobacteria bacterium]
MDKRFEGNIPATNKFNEHRKNERADAVDMVSKLLATFQDNKEAKAYILQIVQNIQKRLNLIEQNTARIIDYPIHKEAQKYGKYYNQDCYLQLMPYCKLAHLSEKNGIPEEHALKLSIMFDEPLSALKYIQDNISQNNLAIHDACLLTLPDVNQCNFSEWKKLIKTNINDGTFRALLPKAPELETILEKNATAAKPNIKAISEKKKEIEKVNKKFKQLDRKHGDLEDDEKEEHKQLLQQLAALKLELFAMSAGIKLHEADLSILAACDEYYLQQTSGAYKYFLQHGLTKDDYAKFLKLERKDDDAQIPNIKLDGNDIGHPDTYLMKVPVLNEMWAAKAACLGKESNCCQSLSGEAGEVCVIYGLTSPYSGFYVLCKGDVNNPKVDDPLLGQCWAWRSKTGAIVFDSIETKSTEENTQNMVAAFFEKLAETLVLENHTNKVACGPTSGISSKVGILSILNETEQFIDYAEYSDSSVLQRVLRDKINPFYLYGKDDASTQETEESIENVMKIDCPLVHSTFLCSLLNHLATQRGMGKNDMEMAMNYYRSEDNHDTTWGSFELEKIREIATKYNRTQEFNTIVETLNLYLGGKLSENEILSAMVNRSFYTSIKDSVGKTTLMYAIKKGYVDLACKLIDEGININEKDKIFGYSAFTMAAMEGNTKVALKLIENGVIVNEKSNGGATALMRASTPDFVRMLLERGAQVNEQDVAGYTPLMCAINLCNIDTATILLENGADIHAKNFNGETALDLLAKTNPYYLSALQEKIN